MDIYSKCAWVIPLKDKKGITITNAFQNFFKESNCSKANSKGCKPNRIWVDKGSEFYNRSMKSWLEKNGIEMYSTHNEGKSIVAERFVRTLKNKVYKYEYIDKLDIVNKFNNTYRRTIEMKPVDVKSSTCIDSSKKINDEDPKFKIGDIIRISK